jgi:hypothetical protein
LLSGKLEKEGNEIDGNGCEEVLWDPPGIFIKKPSLHNRQAGHVAIPHRRRWKN